MFDFDILDVPVNKPKRKMEDYSYTIYGEPKFGKSSFAAEFPNTLFFGFETGQKALSVRLLPVDCWKTFKNYVRALQKAKAEGHKIPYRNFVIDTTDVAWKYCIEWVCRQNGWNHPSDGKMGRGWGAVSDEYFSELDKLSKLGTVEQPCTYINIAHANDGNVITPKGQDEYNKIVPSVPKGCRSTIVDNTDFVIFCTIETILNEEGESHDVRRMYVRSDGSFEAGSRLRHMPDFVEYGSNAKEAYANFKLAFEQAVVDEFGAEDKEPMEKPVLETKQVEPNVEKNKPESKKELEGKSEQENTSSDSLDDVKSQIEDKLKELYSEGMTPVEIVNLIEENTGEQRASEIDNIESAKKLLAVVEGM